MKRLMYLALIGVTLSACEKEEKASMLNGTYSGTFRSLVNNKEQRSEFEVTLDNRRFITNKGGAGHGPFEVGENGKVKFVDELFYTADFDWNTILTGEYKYQLKGDSLILDKIFIMTADRLPSSYQYRLKKIK